MRGFWKKFALLISREGIGDLCTVFLHKKRLVVISILFSIVEMPMSVKFLPDVLSTTTVDIVKVAVEVLNTV